MLHLSRATQVFSSALPVWDRDPSFLTFCCLPIRACLVDTLDADPYININSTFSSPYTSAHASGMLRFRPKGGPRHDSRSIRVGNCWSPRRPGIPRGSVQEHFPPRHQNLWRLGLPAKVLGTKSSGRSSPPPARPSTRRCVLPPQSRTISWATSSTAPRCLSARSPSPKMQRSLSNGHAAPSPVSPSC